MSDRTIVIESTGAAHDYWRDLWQHRDLFWVLAWRDIAVRYKQTLIGMAWAVLRPFVTMVVFTLVFGHWAGLPAEGSAPYALMVFAGTLPWSLFAATLAGAADSMVANGHLIGKVYFPRLIIPAAALATALVDFAVSLALLALVMLWYGYTPGWSLLALPLFVALAVFASIGPGLWIAALNVKYRDFRYVIPFMLQIGLYLSPVGFSSRIVPEAWRWLYALNPMVSVIDGFRWCVLGGPGPLRAPELATGVVVSAFFLWLGLRRFRRTEHAFADLM